MIRLLLTRHGETLWNLERRFQGHQDSPLSELGKEQAIWLSDRLAKEEIDVIYSSPLGRAYTTAQVVNQKQDIPKAIIQEEALKEIGLGDWEGMPTEQFKAENPEEFYNFWKAPHLYQSKGEAGENFQEVVHRVGRFMEVVREKHDGQTVLCVMHAAVLKACLTYLCNEPIEQLWEGAPITPTSLTELHMDQSGVKVCFIADASHYPHQDGEAAQQAWFDEQTKKSEK